MGRALWNSGIAQWVEHPAVQFGISEHTCIFYYTDCIIKHTSERKVGLVDSILNIEPGPLVQFQVQAKALYFDV